MIKDKPNLRDIAEAFRGFDWSSIERLSLNSNHEISIDPKKTAMSHFIILKSNPGSKVHKPYYRRLVVIYKAVMMIKKLNK